MNIEGKVALFIGAAQGIGRAIALRPLMFFRSGEIEPPWRFLFRHFLTTSHLLSLLP